MPPILSVIICTHNPDADRFARVLRALAMQSLPAENWELIVVDNLSDSPVSQRTNYPEGLPEPRIVPESELGLTPARLAGIGAAGGNVLVFVDDDNVLAADYLERARELMDEEPNVGAAGGIIEAEYEVDPEPWAVPYLDLLGIRDFGERPIRALVYNRVGPWEPIGAGMVVRAVVARHYAAVARDPLRRALDRQGGKLGSCGDTDMARCAPDLGFYLAYAPQLRVTHLIPEFRVRYGYFVRLCRSLKRSGILLDRIRTGMPPAIRRKGRWARMVFEGVRQLPSLARPRDWVLRMAQKFGELEARCAYVPTVNAKSE